jgi:hypothetical protein
MPVIARATLIVVGLIGLMLLMVRIPIIGNDTEDRPLLSQSVRSTHNPEDLEQALRLWQQQQFQSAAQLFSHINTSYSAQTNSANTSLYQFYTQAYLQGQNAKLLLEQSFLPQDCTQQLLFVTANIRLLAQAEHFKSRFSQDPRLQSLSICIQPMTWFDPLAVSCEENWQQQGRLGCDLMVLAQQLKSLPFTHLVILAETGKANVHNGIMYLDSQDTYDVFVHELAHFSGFIDEYPLSTALAKRVCSAKASPNMTFKQANDLQWHSSELNQQTHLSPARTCDNHPAQAYKGSEQLTFMEFHDIAFIPESYLKAWQQQLDGVQHLPSAHINFAQSYEQQNNHVESAFWREKHQRLAAPQ